MLHIQLKGNHRYAHAANDEMLEFYYKKSKEVLQSSSLCSKPSGNLDLITINVTKIVSWSDASEYGGRKVVCAYVNCNLLIIHMYFCACVLVEILYIWSGNLFTSA